MDNEVKPWEVQHEKYRCSCNNPGICTFGRHGYIPSIHIEDGQVYSNPVLDSLTKQYDAVYDATDGPRAERRVQLFRAMTAPHNSY